jgi:predicted kinase
MAGEPGSGKSALAKLIGSCTAAVVLDKEVLKSAALSAGADATLAGEIAYETVFAMADRLLAQDRSVIIDSPSFYENIPSRGEKIAGERRAEYYFIECFCPNRAELERRLRYRIRLRSQPGLETMEEGRTTFTPPGAYLRVDTTKPIEECVEMALDYLGMHDERLD